MKNISIKTCVLFSLYTCFAISCREANTKKEQVVSGTAPDLKQVVINLPKAPGSQTFNTHCVICHSASLVQNQPNLPAKTWAAIVTKMQKTFGAPVSDSAAKIIVPYLVTIKGKT